MNRTTVAGLTLIAGLSIALSSCQQNPQLKDRECLVKYAKAPEMPVKFGTFDSDRYKSEPGDTLRPVDNTLTIDFSDREGDILVFADSDHNHTVFAPQAGGIIFVEDSIDGQRFFTMQGNGTELSDVNKSLNALKEMDATFEAKVNALRAQAKEADDETIEKLTAQYNDLVAAQVENLKKFVQENQNLAGAFVYMSNSANFDNDPEMETIIRNMPENNIQKAALQHFEQIKSVSIGSHFIDFALPTPKGDSIRLSDYAGKGKPVLLDFWASWCGPCRMDNPKLVKIYKKFHPKGFEIFAVSLDKNKDAWEEAIKNDNLTWPQCSSLVAWDCPIFQRYMFHSIPNNVLLDGNGIIVAKGLHGEELEEKIAELLK